jgi:hypothetical protein
VNAKLVSGMGPQGIMFHELISHLDRKFAGKASRDIEARQLSVLGPG